MSEPVRIGDLIDETLADLRKRADGYTRNSAVRETLGAQVKTAPRARSANCELVPQGLADADRSAN